MAPTFVASRTALPPEGAAAHEARRSRFLGPGWQETSAATLIDPALAASDAAASPSGTAGLVFYTTGRLTSEMVIKSAQMGVPVVVSRSGITQMGHQVAQSVGLCAIGRATNKRFLCYTHSGRLRLEPGLLAAHTASAGAG